MNHFSYIALCALNLTWAFASAAPTTPQSLTEQVQAIERPLSVALPGSMTDEQRLKAVDDLERRCWGELRAFYASHPHAPERWWAVLFLNRNTDQSMQFLYKDPSAQRQWREELRKINAKMALATDVPHLVKGGFAAADINHDLSIFPGSEARLPPIAFVLEQRLVDFAARFPDDPEGADLLDFAASDLKRENPAASLASFWKRFSVSRNASMAQLAAQFTGGGADFKLPAFTAVERQEVDLAKLSGKVVLVDFWSTICAPCIQQMPALKRLYDRYHSLGFEIIGIALQEADEREKLIRFIHAHDMPWPEYFDGKRFESAPAVANHVRGTPTSYLLDGSGRTLAYGTLENQLTPEAVGQKLAQIYSPHQ
jgi:thiol-disulfide isomerase/thioredoxin